MNNKFYFPSIRSNVDSFYVMSLLSKASNLERKGKEIFHFELGEPQISTPDPIINISKPIYELMSFSMSFIVFGTEEVRTSGSPSVTNTSSSILIPIFKYSFGTFLRSSLK